MIVPSLMRAIGAHLNVGYVSSCRIENMIKVETNNSNRNKEEQIE